jgi:hypothetical protein
LSDEMRKKNRNVIILILIIAVICVLLVVAIENMSESGKDSVSENVQIHPTSSVLNATITFSSPEQNKGSVENPAITLNLYQSNLAYPRNKIATDLLKFIDPNYPKIGIPVDQYRNMRISSSHMIPAGQAAARFNLSNTSGTPVGDQVFLTIYVYPNSSTQILDPFITKVTDRSEELHAVEAWVDLNNLEKIASLESVQNMKFVDYAEHSG